MELHNKDKEVCVPVGPQHPSLKEPEGFLITLRGEKITSSNVKIGYNHRGVEKAMEGRSYTEGLYLVERICGICSHSHSTCYVKGVEEIAGVEVPKRAQYIRMLVGELERIHSHLLWLGVAGHEVGFDTLLMYSWRDREVVMDLLAKITGNRVNYGINMFGGVRRDFGETEKKELLAALPILEERTKYYIHVAQEENTLIQRLSKVGHLTKEEVIRLGTVGPTGRASELDRDVRRDDPYAAYNEIEFKVITNNIGDVYGRTLVRVLELMESYKIIRQIIEKIPDGPVSVRVPKKIPAGEVLSRYEAPRGEDVHYIKANGTEYPERVKVRAPTLANVQAVSKMLEDQYLADLPIVIAAIDPCFSCTDRAITVRNLDKKSENTMDWSALKAYSLDWHKQRGTDFAKLNTKLWEKLK
jgi:NADH-quinone oxidoreductase subunit D